MEKFRIAQYGLMQTAALVYAVLSSGMVWWVYRYFHADTRNAPDAIFENRDFATYGGLLLPLVFVWACVAAYHSSIFVIRPITEYPIVATGWALVALFLIVGTYLAFIGFAALTGGSD